MSQRREEKTRGAGTVVTSVILSIFAAFLVVFIWELFLDDSAKISDLEDRVNKMEVDIEDITERTKGIFSSRKD